jgi:MFS family permease
MRQLTRYQIVVLIVAWLGWVFDSMDATIYNLVLNPALKELLGPADSLENIGWYGGIILAVFLFGWALGGVLFGICADRFGRARTLVVTILIYAVCTGLAGLSHTWWQLAFYRFLTALGIGGEWAAGATLVAEVWPESLRVKGAGILQSAWGAGYFLAAGLQFLLSDHGWRVLFFAGVAPAIVALIARAKVKEPEKWRQARQAGAPRKRLADLFAAAHRRDTLVGSGLAFVAVFGLWGATNWTPSLIREMLAGSNLAAGQMNRMVSYGVMSLNGGAIVGYLFFPALAEWMGRRGAFLVMLLGSAASLPATFYLPHSYAAVLAILPALGFFTNGLFSGFPVYLPELYPTRIRATGAGFCFNAGRILAASGPFVTGYLVAQWGSFAHAASSIAVIYLFGMLLLLGARETKGQSLSA